MRIALIGYGNMGKEIERTAAGRGWQVMHRLDSRSPRLSAKEMESLDVGFHFAKAEGVLPSVRDWARAGKNLVIGTTGWQGDLERVRQIVRDGNIGIVHASNFSIGVGVFLRIVREAGRLFDRFPDYDPSVHEVHHRRKVDSPSGTAHTIADLLIAQIRRKKEILSASPTGAIKPEQLHVSSLRAGETVGIHSVRFDSSADTIELLHTAKNRSGFAAGAILAAEWLQGKRGFFSMDDVLEDLFR